MEIAALIVAAGRGTRLGGDLPKQYQRVGGRPILRRSIDAFLALDWIGPVQVVIHADDSAAYEMATEGLTDARVRPPVAGGATRGASVRAGLEALEGGAVERVLIHDAARPLVGAEAIGSVAAALDEHDGALPALPVADALWSGAGGLVGAAVPREGLWRAQTPQGFRFRAILDAHRAGDGMAADDVAVARAAGLAVKIVAGAEANFKITTPEDLSRAEREVRGRMDVRCGNGYDVHAFGPGDHVTLCGVRIEHVAGLIGHSDADVGMHAITDAIFGALAEGDIGQWFPPSDPQWKGAASEIFLARAVDRVRARGYAIAHLDCTLICETPKIGPHGAAMRREIARICGLDAGRVSVKATTSERLGFTGRGEGIAAQANATLVSA